MKTGPSLAEGGGPSADGVSTVPGRCPRRWPRHPQCVPPFLSRGVGASTQSTWAWDLFKKGAIELSWLVGSARDKYAVRLAHLQRPGWQKLSCRARMPGWAVRSFGCGPEPVYRVKQRFAEEGLEKVLLPSQGPGSCGGEAHLIALACSPAPEGHDHSGISLRLLAVLHVP